MAARPCDTLDSLFRLPSRALERRPGAGDMGGRSVMSVALAAHTRADWCERLGGAWIHHTKRLRVGLLMFCLILSTVVRTASRHEPGPCLANHQVA